MLIDFRRKILFLIFVFIFSDVYSQSKFIVVSRTDTFLISLSNKYYLSSHSPIPNSIRLFLNKKQLNKSNYGLNSSENYVFLDSLVNYMLNDTLLVKYDFIRLKLKDTYRLNKIVRFILPGNTGGKTYFKKEEEKLSVNNIFGNKIKKSGTILRGFTIGSNKDLKLNSGLRLQLSGELAKDVNIVAALTDENTPIQPEGNSERLNELDKVFIQIKHPFANGTFGDFDLRIRQGTFGRIERKLQGFVGEIKSHNNFIQFTYASSRGKFITNKFNGIDGIQGPYELHGKNNEPNIIIIAGSEKVYIDGILMKRGENNDYIIEYSNGRITFMPKRVITSASRITVDFEYTDRKYKREFWGVNSGVKILNGKMKVGLSFFNEGDSKNNPIDVILNEKEKSILRKAGDNPIKASVSGVAFANDSTGKGVYVKIDTLINGKNYSYFKYEPGNPKAYYNVKFSFIGIGKGDYIQVSLGNYRFVGIGKGGFMPVILLPLPENKKNGNLTLNYSPLNNLKLFLDFSGSIYDKNTFSFSDDNDNNGFANKIGIELQPTEFNVGNIKFGKIGFKLNNRFVDGNYSSLDRFNPIEFNRDYNLPATIQGNQSLLNSELFYLPAKNFNITASFNKLKLGNSFESTRLVNKTRAEDFHNINLKNDFDYLTSRTFESKTRWVRENGVLTYSFGNISPGIFYLYEKKTEKGAVDSLLNSSYKYLEVAPYLKIYDFKNFSLNARYSFREESFPLNGRMYLQSRAIMHTYSFKYHGLRGISTSLDLTIRDKKYFKKFVNQNNTNTKTLLIRFNNRFNLFKRFLSGSFYYQTATERTAKLQKIFIRVPEGNGNYIYLGDLNNNGIADEDEFQQTIYNGNYILTFLPTNELLPTIGVKTNARLKLDFKRIIKEKGFLTRVLKNISTETYYRINEKSTKDDLTKIYLLDLNYFLNDSTTITGSQYFQNDFYIYRNNSDLSFRYRYRQRKSLNQFNSGITRTYFRENSFRLRWLLIPEIRNQTEITFKTNNKISPVKFNRTFALEIQELKTEIFYYPYSNLQVSFRIGAMRAKNKYPEKPVIIDENDEAIAVTYYLSSRGRLNLKFERKEFIGQSNNEYLPFEITEGNILGKNYLLSLNLDYRIADNLRITFNYLGREKGKEKIIHFLRGEVRAFF